LFAWVVLGAILERLSSVQVVDRLEHPPDPSPVDPLPAVLSGVSYRYPGADEDALSGLSLSVGAGEFVAVVGPNGSGKSTLARLLAGSEPTTGSVTRPGSPGLGRTGGTAIVLQRPESQILGVRVADDVVWGLSPDGDPVDVAALLETVGLSGMEERDTSTLSGGELQRLALAAALARRPRLLLSDESTAMVDAEGRRALVALLGELPRSRPMTVVHVTHREEEAAVADRVIHLRAGRVSTEPGINGAVGPSSRVPQRVLRQTGSGIHGGVLLQAESVSHTYAAGTPWAQPALDGVDLSVEEGEGLLVVGGNGSGKSTLAWVLAGILRPNHGVCLLEGKPVDTRAGGVGLAFQHARLQLQRPTVGADVRSAGAVDAEAADLALQAVGLEPERFRDRFVDRLSGGEMRRIALAGLLARRPRVLVLDEPFAGLDESSRAGLLELLSRLRSEIGLTLLVISHDMEGMDQICGRTVLLERGRLVGDATDVASAASSVGSGSSA
jgi:energy-coupling factor transport system ATP-binding protein